MSNSNENIVYLSKIKSPEDFKAIPKKELPLVAEELRKELVRVTTQNGGHLASNLGVVELTMAIHRVFNAPDDHIIFDVGHQSYVHKMITGRYEQIDTIRQSGGLSGFMKREESEYDCFGAGHSSTSLSSALGFAVSDKLSGSDAYTVAVVGDGAYTGGMIHEALNNCHKDLRLIIIMNENEMSISPNIGRFANNLSKLRTSEGYFKTKKTTGVILNKIPLIGKWIFKAFKRTKIFFKNAIYGSNYFEGMGLTYLGPVDGNDYEALEKILTQAKLLNESAIIHIKTQKGKGYKPAELSPTDFHSMSPSVNSEVPEKSFSEIMGEHLCRIASEDEKVCAITAAMSDGTGLNLFEKNYPDRFFDVGIAEEHALTFAAGLAANGMKPCVAIYSTFLQRGYDNIIHDIALQNLPVVITIDRAGLNPKDGATHHGIFDVAFLSHIPNLRIYTPITKNGLEASLKDAFEQNSPCAIRYPCGKEQKDIIARFYSKKDFNSIGIKSDFSQDDDISYVIVTHGRIVKEAMHAADMLKSDGINVGIILLEILKPYNETADRILKALPNKTKGIVFLEEEIRSGGMGMNLVDKMSDALAQKQIKHTIIATDDSFVNKVSKGQTIYDAAYIDKKVICEKIKNFK